MSGPLINLFLQVRHLLAAVDMDNSNQEIMEEIHEVTLEKTPEEIFTELIKGRERPAIPLEAVTDSTMEYEFEDDEYNMINLDDITDDEDRLAAINYDVSSKQSMSSLH